jgi:hypothetical protein
MAAAQRPIEGHRKLPAEPEPLCGASAKNDKDVSLMRRAHCLPAIRVCLLIVGVVLLSATTVTLAASAYTSRVATSSSLHKTASSRASERRARSRKSSAARRAKCVAAARGGKHRKAGTDRKAGKSCIFKKSKPRGTKPSVSRKRSGSEPSSSEPPGGSSSSPGEPTTPSEPTPVSKPVAPVEPAAPFRFFSPTSFWNEPVSASVSLDPSSAAVVGAFDQEITAAEEAKKGLPNINVTSWSVPLYTVPADQPMVNVTLLETAKTPVLLAAWDAVPLPSNALPAVGTDKHLVVWQPSTDHLWEFWHLEKTLTGWQAAWGGAMEKASSDLGVYGPEAWSGATKWWGASATSLSIAGGLITLEDLEKGQINHALAMAIPSPRGELYASPAQRTDGWVTAPDSIPEGAHLRLDPNLDLASLKLPRFTLMMAEAAQKYGIFVRDTAGNVAFYAQDPTPTGTNPYFGTTGYFEGKTAQQLLAVFPWSHLQLLKMELHKEV